MYFQNFEMSTNNRVMKNFLKRNFSYFLNFQTKHHKKSHCFSFFLNTLQTFCLTIKTNKHLHHIPHHISHIHMHIQLFKIDCKQHQRLPRRR